MSEAHFRACLTLAHNAIAQLIFPVSQFQGCVYEWESIGSSEAMILTESYLQLRRGVWDFRLNAAPLTMVFNDLSGGLLSSSTSASAIPEQVQF